MHAIPIDLVYYIVHILLLFDFGSLLLFFFILIFFLPFYLSSILNSFSIFVIHKRAGILQLFPKIFLKKNYQLLFNCSSFCIYVYINIISLGEVCKNGMGISGWELIEDELGTGIIVKSERKSILAGKICKKNITTVTGANGVRERGGNDKRQIKMHFCLFLTAT